MSVLQVKAGPKRAADISELDLSALPAARDWRRFEAFCREFLRVPKGIGAHQPFLLLPFQREIARGILPAKGRRPRTGLVSIARGNGKSTLAAALCCYFLFAEEEPSPQVLAVASDLRQARIVFDAAVKMINANPELERRCKVLQAEVQVPWNGGSLFPLPSDEAALQGWDPSAAIVDELHVVTPEVWESITGSAGKREASLVLAISTPPAGTESVMRSLADSAKASPRPDFFYREWTSNPDHHRDCICCWRSANPALGKFLKADGLASSMHDQRELTFRRVRLGQWLEATQDGWIDPAAWRACEIGKTIPNGADVVLSFDGSLSGDSTVLAVVSVEPVPHVEIVRHWSSAGRPEGWAVDVAEVEAAIVAAAGKYNVREVIADPAYWNRSLQILAKTLPVAQFPQMGGRMPIATAECWQAVQNRTLSHGGEPVLTEHVLNAVCREDAHGQRIYKPSKRSAKRIDAAVTLVMGHNRARFHALQETKRRRVVSWRY